MVKHTSACPVGAALDARLAQLEKECAAERERFALEAREHSTAKDRTLQLQVSWYNGRFARLNVVRDVHPP